ncbi:MAG: 30S ribosomal protein S20 [Hyphomicrobiales bacterium]|nr:30S ribosomal protein S20 [Hyphomicrobiales bacterium]MDE2017828.1 30S ribosomal protein S20 [Hyphomicrobiales bacterium]
MANTSSAKKAARQTLRRTDVNKSRRTQMRTTVRKAEEAIAGGVAKDADAAFREAQGKLARSAQKGLVHKNTAARKVARLAKRVKALAK